MKILLGMGGRDDGFEALEATLERAREAGDNLTVAVLETSSEDDVDAVAAAVRERIAESGVDATVRTVRGHPGSELASIAEDDLYAHLWEVQAGEIDELPEEFVERAARRQARIEATDD